MDISELIDNDVALKADGFDAAVVGTGHRCGQPDLLVYDTALVIDILMSRDGMSYEEAEEHLEFNIVGAWAGEGTPIWLYAKDSTISDVEP